MATYRIGIGSFNLKDNAVGIGTESTGLGNLKVEGTYKTTDLDVTGVSTFTRYAGFAADNIPINVDRTLTGEHQTTGDIVVGVNSTFTVSVGATVDVGTVPSVSIGTHFSPPTGGVKDRPEVPVEGTVRYNRDLNTLEFYNGVDWRQFTVNGASGRCLRMGGSAGASEHASSIEYVNINTKGNGINFGELTNSTDGNSAVSSSVRAVNLGGYAMPAASVLDVMDYVTMASTGNAIDFGNLVQGARYMAAATNGTRGLVTGGAQPGYTTMITSFNISTTGNAVDTGGEYAGSEALPLKVYSPIRMILISGKVSSTTQNTMHHINITSTGDTTEFGKMHVRGTGPAASNNVRGIFGGWNGNARVGMRAITIASLGVSSEFGNLTVTRSGTGEGNSSSQTRAIFMGGAVSPTFYNIIDYVNMQTLGDAVDFGDLTGVDIVGNDKLGYASAISDCHGGLGGY